MAGTRRKQVKYCKKCSPPYGHSRCHYCGNDLFLHPGKSFKFRADGPDHYICGSCYE